MLPCHRGRRGTCPPESPNRSSRRSAVGGHVAATVLHAHFSIAACQPSRTVRVTLLSSTGRNPLFFDLPEVTGPGCSTFTRSFSQVGIQLDRHRFRLGYVRGICHPRGDRIKFVRTPSISPRDCLAFNRLKSARRRPFPTRRPRRVQTAARKTSYFSWQRFQLRVQDASAFENPSTSVSILP